MTINLAVKIFPFCVCSCYNTCVSVGPIVNQFTEFSGLVVYPVIRWMRVLVVGGRVWQYLNVAIRQFGDKRIKRRGGKKTCSDLDKKLAPVFFADVTFTQHIATYVIYIYIYIYTHNWRCFFILYSCRTSCHRRIKYKNKIKRQDYFILFFSRPFLYTFWQRERIILNHFRTPQEIAPPFKLIT